LDIPGKVTFFNAAGAEIPDLRPANNTPNWYPDWDRVPDNSMDMIWAQECPIKHPFWAEDINIHLNFEDIADAPFLEGEGSLDDVWRNLLQHGKRILKEKGKIVVPLPEDDMTIDDATQLTLIARIINMEVVPDFLYKIQYIKALSERQRTQLQNLFILKPMNAGLESYRFLVFEKP
jgi:hypothetical protein